ncbi:hypothetical protein ACJX0J_008670, partial [Zea mays]
YLQDYFTNILKKDIITNLEHKFSCIFLSNLCITDQKISFKLNETRIKFQLLLITGTIACFKWQTQNLTI